MTYEDFTYKQDIEKHFRQFDKHETVQMLERLIEDGFSFDTPPGAMLLMNSDFSLDMQSYERAANERVALPNLQEFFTALQKFSADSGFNSFYDEHREYGFGPSIEKEDGTSVYSIIGPGRTDNNNPVFGSADGFEYLQLHEFGHSFIELNTDEIMPLVEKSEYLFATIEQKMAQKAYPQWDTTLEETILRATTVKIQREDNSPEAKEHLKMEADDGFIYIETVYNSLMKYEKNREKYPDFQSFIPVILEDLMSAYKTGQ